MLVIVTLRHNVSDRLRNLVVYALQSRYSVEAIDTQERNHATEICREAAREGYDVVVAFGGDGTVNEAANGLAGSDTPLTSLPGGSTNVWARTLGIPNDVVDATEHLLSMADSFEPRQVDLGRVNGRYFVFASGVGLDASVVERVDSTRCARRATELVLQLRGDRHLPRRYLSTRRTCACTPGPAGGRRDRDRPELRSFTSFARRPLRWPTERAFRPAPWGWRCCAAPPRWSCPH